MPIQLHEEDGRKIPAVHVGGKLAKADYAHLVPEFERLVRPRETLRVLFDVRGFQGWKPGALWDEIKFDVKHFDDIGRLAVVGGREWQHDMAMCFKPFTKTAVRYFNDANAAEARGGWTNLSRSGPDRNK